MVSVVTAELAGAAAGLLAAVAAGHSGVTGFVTGVIVGIAVLAVLMEFQREAWQRIREHQFFGDEPSRHGTS